MKLEGRTGGINSWSIKPGLVALVTVTALALLCQLPGMISFVMIPLTLLGFGLSSIAILATVVFFFVKSCPRRAISFFSALLLPVLFWRPIAWGTSLIHLGLTVGLEIGQLGVSPKSNDGAFEAYDWSVGFAGGPTTILIRDLTDEIALPVGQHTMPLSFEDGFGEECAGRVQHLVKHYYVCSI